MSKQVDLVYLSKSGRDPAWELGAVHQVRPNPRSVHSFIEKEIAKSTSTAWLFWDSSNGELRPDVVMGALRRGDLVFHAGLKLGMQGVPRVLDYVAPNWIFNLDPPPEIEATSWRMSLRACLMPLSVFRQIGNINPDYESLAGASVEFGHRCINNGVLMRHLPSLLNGDATPTPQEIPDVDQWHFVADRYGKFWTRWALSRAAISGEIGMADAARVLIRARNWQRRSDPQPYRHAQEAVEGTGPASVTIIIPTVDRYPYLRSLLSQLKNQTVPPEQIIVVDQTEKERFDPDLATDLSELPLRVVYQDAPGQCTARNTALQMATGDYILFLDDDEGLEEDLIERHLATLRRFDADISCGTVDEVGAGELPAHFGFLRASDVFPAGNSMIRKSCMKDSGLFDLAYDKGVRADGDLGIRLYLSGKLAILDPENSVLHYRAPQGGLRKHKSRVVTYAASRTTIRRRHLPEVTEVYLLLRHFSERQLRESLCQRLAGTLRVRGSIGRRVLKLALGMFHLPASHFKIRTAHRKAIAMLSSYPKVPRFSAGFDEVAACSPSYISSQGRDTQTVSRQYSR